MIWNEKFISSSFLPSWLNLVDTGFWPIYPSSARNSYLLLLTRVHSVQCAYFSPISFCEVFQTYNQVEIQFYSGHSLTYHQDATINILLYFYHISLSLPSIHQSLIFYALHSKLYAKSIFSSKCFSIYFNRVKYVCSFSLR